MKEAYLTIDDSPTRHTDALTDFLVARNIPATLFCIGGAYKDLHLECEGIEQNPGPIVRAIEKGFLIGNHTYTHQRSSVLSYEEIVAEIEKTEKLIDNMYRQAGMSRPAKVMRFPHLDRGAGGWVVDYKIAGEHGPALQELFGAGLNITLDALAPALIEKKQRIQDYLAREGFVTDIYKGITFPWYQGEMSASRDLLYTYSTSDWMMNPDFSAYNKDWAYHSVEALKGKIDDDPWLKEENSVHLVLAHDHNNMFEVTTALIDHMVDSGLHFIEV